MGKVEEWGGGGEEEEEQIRCCYAPRVKSHDVC